MVTIANITADAGGDKNVVLGTTGLKNVTANYAPATLIEPVTVARQTYDFWVFSWSNTTTPFDLYLRGAPAVLDTTITSYGVTSDDEPALEVYGSNITDLPYTVEHKPTAEIYWYSNPGQEYDIERYIDGNWVAVGQPISNSGIGYYSISTAILGDAQDERWRVVPYNQFLSEGDPVEELFTVVSYPDPPEYTAAVTGGNLVISEA